MGNPIAIELDEEIEGDDVGSINYLFAKIGEPLPISNSAGFDPAHLPSRPLAVSEHFRLLFVAHPHGFYVTRTKDILAYAEEYKEKKGAGPSVHDTKDILASAEEYKEKKGEGPSVHDTKDILASAEEYKEKKGAGPSVHNTKDILASAEECKEKKGAGPSVHDFSLVDISLEKISILALSTDDSALAVCVPTHVHFFAVSAFLHKETKPSYSISLDESIQIKDFCWARKFAKDYIILAAGGKLYRGSGQGPISYVMEDVDAVDWSVKGNFLAVAKRNRVSILSSHLKERSSFLLQFSSVTGDSDVNQVIKVDSIRWIRSDCIAVGCFQINEDGEEENYIVQLITNKGKRITDVSESSKPTVLSFSNAFIDFSTEVVPVKDEPHMFLSYLDHCGLAFVASRNLSSSVGLFCWAQDNEQSEVAIVDILKDVWNLTIDSQDNGEENVLVGISVDKVSQNENATFTLLDEHTEASPCCIIICLTIDGKISVFHFVSAASTSVSPIACPSDEDDSEASTKHELHLLSSAVDEESKEPTFMMSSSRELGGTKTVETGTEASVTKRLSQPFQGDLGSQEQNISESTGWRHPLTMQASEPKTNLPVALNDGSNEECEPVSEGKNGIASFLGKAGGDIFHQSINKYPLSSSNMEPVGKVPPRSSESMWFLPKSNARMDGSNISNESFMSSNMVDHSNKPASQSAGGVLQHPTDLKEKEKPSFSFSSFGQTWSSGQVNKNSAPANPVSQASFGESAVSGKSSQPEYKKGLKVASSTTGLSFPQSTQKQFGNVLEMAKKLDSLLEDIEGEAGFRDASITSQTQRLAGLEESIWALSNRCRIRKGLVDKQLREVELLFDKMIQVSIRKVYMEGIFKQAKDSRYWELWNRQKLSSELDLKRRRILQLNQELVNKLIELERHFNSLEFNKFGEIAGMQNRRVLQNWQDPSRKIQSLYSLHSTIQAQLTAAEQLSGCLSQQMAALSIESTGKQDFKKQLLDSIGLSYAGDSPRSLARDGTFGTPPKTEHSDTSGPFTAKVQSNRNHTTFVKSEEPETARRRRESLDHSWASFDPPKTTVKRMLKEDYGKGGADQSLLNTDKRYSGSQVLNKSDVDHSALLNISGAPVSHIKTRGTIEIPTEQSSRNSSTSVYQRTAGLVNRGLQLSSSKSPQPILESSSSENRELGGAIRLIAEKSKSSLAFTGQTDSSASASKLVPKSNTSIHSLTSISKQLPEHLLSPPSGSIADVDCFQSGLAMSTTWDQKNSSAAFKAPSFDSKSLTTPASTFSSGLNVSEKGLFKNDGSSASTTLQSVVGPSLLSSSNLLSVSSFASKLSSSTESPTIPMSGASVAAKSEAPKPLAEAAVPSMLNFPSALTSLTHVSSLSSVSISSGVMKSESLTSHSHPSPVMSGTIKHDDSHVQTSAADVTSNTGKDDNKVQAPQPGLSVSELAEASDAQSGKQIDANNSSKISPIVISDAKLDLPQTTEEAVSSIAQSPEVIVGSAKTVTLDVSNEEEMEESPEAQEMTEFAFGNLSGFGIGATPNSAMPKSNPFGVGVVKQDSSIATSPLIPSSSGELFRPAAFNFQAPHPLEPLKPAVSFSGGFSSGNPGQVSGSAGFGQPAQIGAGQQALGSVLGTFGQSRQLGGGLSGGNFASGSGYGGGNMGISAGGAFGGGFTSASTGGGFAGLASNAGGFAAAAGGGFASAVTAGGGFGFGAAATGGGGFGAAATGGGGFGAAATASGGFGAVAGGGGGFGSALVTGAVPGGGGGGFGGFGSQQGQSGGGFSTFSGSGTGGTGGPPSQLFTQMRK